MASIEMKRQPDIDICRACHDHAAFECEHEANGEPCPEEDCESERLSGCCGAAPYRAD